MEDNDGGGGYGGVPPPTPPAVQWSRGSGKSCCCCTDVNSYRPHRQFSNFARLTSCNVAKPTSGTSTSDCVCATKEVSKRLVCWRGGDIGGVAWGGRGGALGARGRRAAAWRSVRLCCCPESLQPLMDTSSPPEPNTPHNICSQTAALTPNAAPRRPIPPAGGGARWPRPGQIRRSDRGLQVRPPGRPRATQR